MYDVVVIGARCAGSSTAMLLAQRGYSVLAVDRATFPSDTVSTHIVKRPGVRQLEAWGLLEDVLATGSPPIPRVVVDVGDFPLSGRAPPADGVPMVAPRRTVLDELLVEAAEAAGAEVREGFAVRSLLEEDGRVVGIEGQQKGGTRETIRARVVVGADGKNSLVARTVGAPTYDDVAPLAFYYYTYWRDLPVDALETYWRHHRFVLGIPTNDDLTCLVVGRPIADLRSFSADVERNYHDSLAPAPHLQDAVRDRQPVERFVGTAVPNYFRRPYGPGWALVGDAGLCMDPLFGHGISDAFCDAELLADAIDAGLEGETPLQEALQGYEAARNDRKADDYEHNSKLARMEGWDTPPFPQLRAALRDNPDEADRWAGTIALSVDRDDFYASSYVREAMAVQK